MREIGLILHRRRWFLLFSLLMGVGVGLGLASLRSPTYQASTLILVEGDKVPNLSALQLLGGPLDVQRVATEMELLQSRKLARTVVDALALQFQVASPAGVGRSELFSGIRVAPGAEAGEYRFRRTADDRFEIVDREHDRVVATVSPGDRVRLGGAEVALTPAALRHEHIDVAVSSHAAAVDGVVSGLEVERPGPETNLVRVQYSGSDPELVRDVLNALTGRFMALRESMQKSEARSTVKLLREQLDTLARQLTVSEERLQNFREGARVINPEVEATTRISHVAQLQAQRAELNAERAALATLVAEARSAPTRAGGASPYRKLIAFPTLLRSQATSELLRSLTQVEEQRTALLSRRTPEDPEVQILTARLGELESQLQGLVGTYLQGLTNQVSAMDATLGQYRAELAQTPEKEVQYARLSRQPRALQEMYQLLQTRLKEAEIAEAVENPSVRVVDEADLPREPVGPGSILFAGISGIAGLLLGLGVVMLREYTDSAVRTRADVQAAIGIPVLGLIPRVNTGTLPRWRRPSLSRPRLLLPAISSTAADGDGHPAPGESGATAAAAPARVAPALVMSGGRMPVALADAFSRLHANVSFSRPDADTKVLVMTSPLPGDGKTTTAVHFALALAQSGLKVLLIDADLRRGTVHEFFGVSRGPGLTDLLSETPVFEGVLRHAEVGERRFLRFITAGSGTSHPVQTLGSPVMRELLAGAAQEYDRIIIDSPPLNLFPDAAVLGSYADGVLIVARAEVTSFDALVDAAEQLERAATPVVGAVLNGVDFRRGAAYDRAYRYYTLGESYQTATPAGAGAE